LKRGALGGRRGKIIVHREPERRNQEEEADRVVAGQSRGRQRRDRTTT